MTYVCISRFPTFCRLLQTISIVNSGPHYDPARTRLLVFLALVLCLQEQMQKLNARTHLPSLGPESKASTFLSPFLAALPGLSAPGSSRPASSSVLPAGLCPAAQCRLGVGGSAWAGCSSSTLTRRLASISSWLSWRLSCCTSFTCGDASRLAALAISPEGCLCACELSSPSAFCMTGSANDSWRAPAAFAVSSWLPLLTVRLPLGVACTAAAGSDGC